MNKPQQVVLISGGQPHRDETAYRIFLEQRDVNIDYFRAHSDWKRNLQKTLGNDYDILMPPMPCRDNAQYELWKLWFENCCKVFDEKLILVGHSLGAIFLAKYLSENLLPKKIVGLLLIAAPYDTADDGAMSESWRIDKSLSKIEKQTSNIFLYHSKDDPVVPYTELDKYAQALPKAEMRTFEDAGHFNMERLPEIEQDIKSLCT